MTLANVLTSEAGLTLVSGILGGIWTLFKSSEWFRKAKDQRYAKAMQALEAGVEQTYRTYVKAIKDARADGKLTDEEAARARQQARDTAIAFGKSQGVDVLTELGGGYLDLWIGKLVKRLKAN
jgi:hypothetical protein